MAEAHINHKMLNWAIQRASIDLEILSAQTKFKLDKLEQWEKGETKPTFNQAQTLAQKLRIPFGYLFLTTPPEMDPAVPDLRTIGSHVTTKLSLNLRELLMSLLMKQDWYRDYVQEHTGEPIKYIGRFNSNTPASVIANDITKTLELSIEDRKIAKSWEAYFTLLIQKIESLGILVMRSGVVGSNNQKILDIDEFRGIALFDPYAPLIFINGRDAKAAQTFTLIHELVHLWIGQSGISDPAIERPATSHSKKTEQLCNEVAAEVLVPRNYLIAKWSKHLTVSDNAENLAPFFRVSSVVIARRAYSCQLIPWKAYSDYYAMQSVKWNNKKNSSGGNYYNTLPAKNSKTFTSAVISSARANNILLRDAGKLLNIKPAKIKKLATEMGAR
ncbi:ImmA/IrrE family metallo-endopeptidase [Halodesulfovibrio aestuarii]|uniref:Zn-dependent peptidase ImmA, M78 family n=1 Tax=Halodesulfovibrio aestuarii TaxID=126333 RepID=A0A8G2C985_9BACT|nr:ImmA/IrrE family metallo-endopeptidase [Halodesulfovibrio aestuarii]SHJ05303.1 Zn-dependent peptidase ImmA, M78 family [Halodesulfovibrio aestuarii]